MRNEKNQEHLIGWPRVLVAWLMAAAMLVGVADGDDQTPPQLTLPQALEQAFQVSPVLRAHLAELQEAEAGLLGARTYPFNPEFEFATADRSGGGTSSTDSGFALSQEIEIGGQRSKRIAVASASFESAASRFAREKRLLAAQIEISFADATRARELVRVARADAGVTSNLLDFAERRLNAGAGTEIELNLARSAAGRAESNLRQTEARYEEARSRLAEVIGLDPATAPQPDGDLPAAPVELPALSDLLDSALRERADLAALRRGTQAEQAGLRLARSRAIPNLRIGAFYEKEAGIDSIKGFGVALPIPLFNRNRGEVAELEARVLGATAEASAAELTIRREVVSAYAHYEAATRSAAGLRDLVIGGLEENLDLLQRSLEVGKINASDVLVFRREFVESQREYVETLTEAWVARVTLELASGQLRIPPTSTVEAQR